MTGGTKLGMMIARPKTSAVYGTTDWRPAPSRTWRCQSSGRVMTSSVGAPLEVAADANEDARRLVACVLICPAACSIPECVE